VDLAIYIGSVPIEYVDDFEDRLSRSLQKVASDGIDTERMGMVINRDERQFRSKLESARGDVFSGTIIDDFLYGETDGSELPEAMDEISAYDTLRGWTSEQWTSLLRK
jgi:Zn-dependent M16 (insulinase) family peptidase